MKRRVSEGLTLVAIGSVLTAILLPVLRLAPGSQDDETCLSHLRQIGMACAAYSADYDGYLVPYTLFSGTTGQRWTLLVAPYVNNDAALFKCPLDLLSDTPPEWPLVPTTYGVNWYLSSAAGVYYGNLFPGRHAQTLYDPAGTIQAADSAVILKSTAALPAEQWREDAQRAPGADIFYFYLPQHPETGVAQTQWSNPGFSALIVRPFPRHAGYVNALFYDGHSAAVPASQFDPAVTKWGDTSCLWDNVAGTAIGMTDVRKALQSVSGLYKPSSTDMDRLNVDRAGASENILDLSDAATLVRKATELAPHP